MRAVLIALVLVGAGGCSSHEEPTSEASVPTATIAVPTPTPTTTTAPVVGPAEARRLGLEAVAALKHDRPAQALALIQAGADVNAQDSIQDSVFLYAGAEGYADVVANALNHGADTRVLNRFGGTALIPAAEHAHVEVIRMLLTTDIEVDHVNDLGWTALGEAVALGDGGTRSQQAVRLLLAAGADPNAVDRFGRTVLQNAVRLGYDEIVAIIRELPTD